MQAKIIKIFAVLFLLFIYRNWFISEVIIGGDWPFYYPGLINTFNFLPPIWSEAHGNGIGGTILSYGIDTYMRITGTLFTNIIGISWPIVYKISWFLAYLLLSFIGATSLFKKMFEKQTPLFSVLSGIIYASNTYILMVVGGGQMGVALAYSLFPFVILHLINLIDSLSEKKITFLKNAIVLGISLGVQTLFDPRISYISIIVVILLSLLISISKHIHSKQGLNQFLLRFSLSIVIFSLLVVLLNSFWLIPLIFVQQISQSSIGISASTSEVLKFYSFANLSNSITLLHPNWPENIFGKVAFMRPEFIFLPIIAFFSLIFKNKNRNTLYLSLLALIGAFLSKGINPPVGFFYEFLFTHVPGFVVFRDPTKFYLLVALPFSILIPYTFTVLNSEFSKIKKLSTLNFQFIFIFLFIIYWTITIYPAFSGNLTGTFNRNTFATEYLGISNELAEESTFFRTLWVPRQSRLADPTIIHPAVEAFPLFNATSAAELYNNLRSDDSDSLLSSLSIKYIILPTDPYGELFIENRMYSNAKREEFENMLDSINKFEKIRADGISIYQLRSYKGLFSTNSSESAKYSRLSDTEYKVRLDPRTSEVIFSQNFHPGWRAYLGSIVLSPVKTKHGLMQFGIPKNSGGEIKVIFEGRRIYSYSLILTIFTIFLTLAILGVLKLKNYEK